MCPLKLEEPSSVELPVCTLAFMLLSVLKTIVLGVYTEIPVVVKFTPSFAIPETIFVLLSALTVEKATVCELRVFSTELSLSAAELEASVPGKCMLVLLKS